MELQAPDNQLESFAAAILQQECFPHICLICLLAISHMEALNGTLAFSTVHVFERKEKERERNEKVQKQLNLSSH